MPRRHPDARLRIISHLVQVAVHQPAGPAGPCGEQLKYSDPDILSRLMEDPDRTSSWTCSGDHCLYTNTHIYYSW